MLFSLLLFSSPLLEGFSAGTLWLLVSIKNQVNNDPLPYFMLISCQFHKFLATAEATLFTCFRKL
jgi:hypothetical protein